jgi:hypothetical protein
VNVPVISKLAAPGTQRHQDALAVLDATRSVVARGWTQRTWFVMETPRGRRRLAQRFFPTRLDHRRVVEACLVGAVVHGAHRLSGRPEYAYPALDALWNALFDAEMPGEATADPVGPLTPPVVRAARVRDLTTWNDRSYRTKQDVLRLIDQATARVSGARVRT